VAGIVRLRTQALHRRAERLEKIVADRTQELAQSNAQLATQNAELARLHRLELDEKLAAQLSEEKARLELLRYQLNPHFLLNAFTTLRSLVFSSPEAAGRTVERLADFCRLALTRSDESGATVDAEVRLIESYLDTEQARWRDELQVEMQIDPAARPLPLPPFLLQPLVENAIKYGGRTSPGTLRVRVSIRVAADSSASSGQAVGRPDAAAGLGTSAATKGAATNVLLIEIANTGEWVEGDSPHRQGSTGIGLENLHQRLRRQYRDAHEFTTDARDGWVFVKLRLISPAR
jgi:LytS/YehU family sensor histidine kinase